MREIACRAGKSVTTVSKALRDDPKIGSATRTEIKRIARELGFTPNPLVTALMQHKRASRQVRFEGLRLGVIHGRNARSTWADQSSETFRNYFDGVETAAAEMGFGIDEFVVGEDAFDPTLKSTLKTLRARGIRGFVFFALPEPLLVARDDMREFAGVEISYSSGSGLFDTVISNLLIHALEATSHLIAGGSRRPVLAFRQKLPSEVLRLFQAGFLQACHECGVAGHIWGRQADRSLETALRKGTYDGVVDISASLPVQASDAGKRIHHRVLDLRKAWHGQVPGIDQNNFEVGMLAARRVIELILQNRYGLPEYPVTSTIKGRLVV